MPMSAGIYSFLSYTMMMLGVPSEFNEKCGEDVKVRKLHKRVDRGVHNTRKVIEERITGA